MVRKSMGPRRRSRRLKSEKRLTVNDWIKDLKVGDIVHIDIKPSVHPVPHKRYQGKTGRIAEIRGKAYVVEVKLGNKTKKLILKPPHVKLANVQKAKVVG